MMLEIKLSHKKELSFLSSSKILLFLSLYNTQMIAPTLQSHNTFSFEALLLLPLSHESKRFLEIKSDKFLQLPTVFSYCSIGLIKEDMLNNVKIDDRYLSSWSYKAHTN